MIGLGAAAPKPIAPVSRPVRTATSPTTDGVAGLAVAAQALAASNVAVEDLSLRQPTLDEVFLTLTGASTESDQPSHEGEEVRS